MKRNPLDEPDKTTYELHQTTKQEDGSVARKKSQIQPHYGEPTEIVSIRMPKALARKVTATAKRSGKPSSRKFVELIEKGLVRSGESTRPGAFD